MFAIPVLQTASGATDANTLIPLGVVVVALLIGIWAAYQQLSGKLEHH